MRDLDLGVLETLIVFFLFMPVIRPFVKSLWKAEGIVWLPAIAFLCTVGIFFAYGFRPECVPLLLYIIIVNILNTGNVFNFLTSVRSIYIERNIPLFFVRIIFLGCAAALAIVFLPYNAVDGSADTSKNTQALEVKDNSNGAVYTVRIYGGGGAEKAGTVFLAAPPVLGSTSVTDTFFAAFAKRVLQRRVPAEGGGSGIVVTFSRSGFDVPAWGKNGSPILPPPEQILRVWRVLVSGLKTKAGNKLGRELEAERLASLRFIMNWLKTPNGIRAVGNANAVLIAGYGAGGGAAVSLASDAEFVAAHPEFCGVLAVETYLYGAFAAEDEKTPYSSDVSGFEPLDNALNGARNWIAQKIPLKIEGAADAPKPLVPVRFIVSGYDTEAERYAAAQIAAYKAASSGGMARILSIPNTCAFDWTDVPQKYPILRFAAAPFRDRAWAEDNVTGAADALRLYAEEILPQQAENPAPQTELSKTELSVLP
ncbi:MAG: hypothetical protein LBG72_09285 [Spirochaetaceae bacterium]|jgi:hypothetical protein|nr:hypothetical protein [Spirochaetaceae bacterium]